MSNKKLIYGTLILMLLISTCMPLQVNAISLNIDGNSSSPSTWAESYITYIIDSGDIDVDEIMGDYQSKITRREFAYIAVKLYEYYTNHELIVGFQTFEDTQDEWILKAKNAGIVSGYPDGTYKPDNLIRRDEIATLFVNILKSADVKYTNEPIELFNDDSNIAIWAKESVYIAKTSKIINGVGENNFEPSGNATREQSLIMLYNAMNEIQSGLPRPLKLGVEKINLREVESEIINGRREDNLNYPFETDDLVLGKWIAVDFVNEPLLFNPDIKRWSTPLYCNSIEFYSNGTVKISVDVNYKGNNPIYESYKHTWTSGLFINYPDSTASRYFVATVNSKEYLFLEWKSGDYTIRNMTPKYYVYESINND